METVERMHRRWQEVYGLDMGLELDDSFLRKNTEYSTISTNRTKKSTHNVKTVKERSGYSLNSLITLIVIVAFIWLFSLLS